MNSTEARGTSERELRRYSKAPTCIYAWKTKIPRDEVTRDFRKVEPAGIHEDRQHAARDLR
jgi:hypothetical protein